MGKHTRVVGLEGKLKTGLFKVGGMRLSRERTGVGALTLGCWAAGRLVVCGRWEQCEVVGGHMEGNRS